MILDTSNINTNDKQLITDVVGKSYTFFQAVKLGSVDSKLMSVDEISDYLAKLLGYLIGDTYASIELRPKGIVIRLHKRPQTLTWVITYDHLQINMIDGVRISEGNHFIKFTKESTLKDNRNFFKKLSRLKSKCKKVVYVNQKNKPFYNILN